MSIRPINVFGRMILAATLAVGLAGGQAARAAAVETYASLDWSGFTVDVSGTNLTWSNLSDAAYASVGGSGLERDFEPDWTTGTSATATNLLGTARAFTEPTQVTADIITAPQRGFALALRSATLMANGAGVVEFSVPYTLELVFSEAANPASFGEVLVELALYDGNSLVDSVFERLSGIPSGSTGGDTITQTGVLVLAVALADGQSLDFEAAADGSVTVIPLPAPVWLFGSALFALGFIGRRKPRAGSSA